MKIQLIVLIFVLRVKFHFLLQKLHVCHQVGWGQRLAGQMSPNESWVLLCRWRQTCHREFCRSIRAALISRSGAAPPSRVLGSDRIDLSQKYSHHYRNDSSCLTCNLCIKGFEAALSGTSDRWKEQLCFLLIPWWRNIAHEVDIMRAVVLYICAFRLLLM